MGDKNERRVFTTVEVGVNYVTHLYTLAKAFEDEEYYKKYQSSISVEDRDYLKSNMDLMAFQGTDHGYLAVFLYFMPSYSNIETKEGYENYFFDFNKALKDRSFSPLKKYCPEIYHFDDETWQKSILPDLITIKEVFRKIADIYIENIDYYLKKIWPEVKTILEERSRQLNKNIQLGLIEKWEQVTGYKFVGDNYYFVLYYAGANGPSFNNLSLEKNTAFYDHEQNFLLDMFSHELGIHVLLPDLIDLISKYEKELPRINKPDVYGLVSYMAFETMAIFLNRKVLARETCEASKWIDFTTFNEIYIKIYSHGMSPLEMYEKAVNEYMELNKDYIGDYEKPSIKE
ncbi:hypothetical protein [Natronospora cellulosivora (SeqCode)]